MLNFLLIYPQHLQLIALLVYRRQALFRNGNDIVQYPLAQSTNVGNGPSLPLKKVVGFFRRGGSSLFVSSFAHFYEEIEASFPVNYFLPNDITHFHKALFPQSSVQHEYEGYPTVSDPFANDFLKTH